MIERNESGIRGRAAVPPMARLCGAYLAVALAAGGVALVAAPAMGEEGGNALTAAQSQAGDNTPAVFEKTEVVYATLTPAGRPTDAYVVNRFEVEEAGYVYDLGEYTRVVPLSGASVEADPATGESFGIGFLSELGENGARGGDVEVGTYAYQGDMKTIELPWDITVVYRLDGRVVTPEELAGQSGHVSIKVDTAANEAADPAFFESFMLQMTFTLNGDTWQNVKADGATVAMAGSDKTVAFTALPGKDATFELEADVTDFALSGTQIAALPYGMDMDLPDAADMEGDITQLSDAIGQLSDGAHGLADGADRIAGGMDELDAGTRQFGSGLRTLAGSSDTLIDGSAAIKNGLATMAAGFASGDFSQAASFGELPSSLRAMAGGLDEMGSAASSLHAGYSQALTALEGAVAALPEPTLSEAEIGGLMATAQASANPADAATASKLVETYQAAATVKGTYAAVKEAFDSVGPLLEAFGADASTQGSPAFMAASLRSIADGLDSASSADSLAQLGALAQGLQQLSGQYAQFHDGLLSYTRGVKRASSGFGTLGGGLTQLAQGTAELSSGTTRFADGAQTLADETSDMPETMQEQIDSLMADYDFPPFDPVSFVDARNESVVAVQFVMTLDAIEAEEPAQEVSEEEEEPTILDRFFALFG